MLIILLLQLGLSFSSEKYNVCSITINSDDEVKAFKKHLSPKDFNFVELTDHIDPAAKAKGNIPHNWFDQVCERDVRCDVLLISGHFGGDFFGDSGISLPLETLEQASCQHKCQNILNSAQEVFLFGCNTLATKEQDHRTPAQYVDVLVQDGIDRTQAERIAQARYGALGSSFKDRMQRVFENVPNIYGFDSVGPSGKTIKPFLDKYFTDVGDYKQHILKLQTQGIVDILGKGAKINQNLHNPELAKALSNTAYAECSGITPDDPAYRVKKEICKFYDENLSMDNKVALAEALLSTDDALLYIPTIASYFSQNDSSALNALRNNDKIKNLLDSLAQQLEGSPGVYIDMLNLQLNIGFIDEGAWSSRVKNVMKPFVRKMDRASADVLCSIMQPEGNYEMEKRMEKISFTAEEMNLSQLSKKEGLDVLMCLNIAPESASTISKELVKLKDQQRGEEHKIYYYMAALDKTTPEDTKLIASLARADLDRLKNSEYRAAIQLSLVQAYGKIEDIKSLEGLYQTGNLYPDEDWDTRWNMIGQSARMISYSSFYERKAIDYIKKNWSSSTNNTAGEMLGAVRDEVQVTQLIEFMKQQPSENLAYLYQAAASIESSYAGKPQLHPRLIDVYIDQVALNPKNLYTSSDIYRLMTQEQIARLKKYVADNPNTGASSVIQNHLRDSERD